MFGMPMQYLDDLKTVVEINSYTKKHT